MRPRHGVPFIALLLASPLLAQESIDAFWTEVVRAVEAGDFEGLWATYADQAVLVSGPSKLAVPVAQAMAGWKADIDATREGRLTVTLAFRFSGHIRGDSVALETGIFRYSSKRGDEEPRVSYVHLEGLLVRGVGGWRMMMEHQVANATEEEWDALGRGGASGAHDPAEIP